jgi:hypothetical protein
MKTSDPPNYNLNDLRCAVDISLTGADFARSASHCDPTNLWRDNDPAVFSGLNISAKRRLDRNSSTIPTNFELAPEWHKRREFETGAASVA